MIKPTTTRAALLGMALLLGCNGNQARPACDAQENANLRIAATDRANPDTDGRPLPTIVRIYQLFEEIWNTDEDILGDALLGKDELTVYPDTTLNRQFERNPEANYIVGMAVVRRPTGVSWRSILELPPPQQEAQCAALQENPEEAPPEPPNVYLAFELDDYQIEGAVRLEYPPPPCDPNDPICAAERAAEEQASGVEAPETPETPEAPQPDVPSAETPSAPAP